ncbi:MAG: phage tail family protein [Lachnospiraceae bacterium]|nr:phage tail family protein [Lachnospiraceae bacterium]
MLEIKVKNERGEVLEFGSDPRYVVTASGLSPAAATINMSKAAMNDGAKYNSSRVNERNIVLMIYLLKDVEAARLNLYRYFPPKRKCTLYLKNGARDVYIEGYVETFECDLYAQGQCAQVSVLCPDPYFQDIDGTYTGVQKMIPLFEFPFAIEKDGVEMSQLYNDAVSTVVNKGDVETGLVIELRSSERVVNPSVYNKETRQAMSLRLEMQEGDRVVIDTNVGEKSVTLHRGGVSYNIINRLAGSPSWLQVSAGTSMFTYKCDEGYECLSVVFSFRARYMGV